MLCRRSTDCHVASLLAMTMGGRTCIRAHVFPSACHCEPVRTLVRQSVFPAGKLGKLVVLRANSRLLRIRREKLLSALLCCKENGLPRRFAPRNDMQKLAACPRLQLRATSQTRSRLQIRLKCCFSFCAAAGEADCPVASLLAMTMGGRTCTR